jgi:biopolymer transport protein ExbD
MTNFLNAPHRRRAFFMLTPLVDIMFLLLIFFMLTSETSLYTLMRISAQAVAAGPAAAAASPTAELVVAIGHQQVRLNGVAMPTDQVAAVLAQFKAQGVVRAALVAGQAAEVQDIVSALELLEAAAFSQVRLVAGGGVP